MPADARIRDVLVGLFGDEAEPALSASDVASHARDLLEVAGANPEILERSLTERTVRYYQSQGIVTPPSGNTSNARYGIRQVLEAAAARLAGSVRHLSLAEAAEEVAARDADGLVEMIADLLAKQPRPTQRARPLYAAETSGPSYDASNGSTGGRRPSDRADERSDSPDLRGDDDGQPAARSRQTDPPADDGPPESDVGAFVSEGRPGYGASRGTPEASSSATAAWVVDLGDGAFLTIPTDHALLRSGQDLAEIRRRILESLDD
jgi:DNA-binding transcriptional MerR regulator